jgi:hypothetical protein
MKCSRCGLPIQITDTDLSHLACDEMLRDPDEIVLTPEEKWAKEERIRAYQRRQRDAQLLSWMKDSGFIRKVPICSK